jgi:hypothetical protein
MGFDRIPYELLTIVTIVRLTYCARDNNTLAYRSFKSRYNYRYLSTNLDGEACKIDEKSAVDNTHHFSETFSPKSLFMFFFLSRVL